MCIWVAIYYGTTYHLPINYLSTTYQLPINYLLTTYQLPMYQLPNYDMNYYTYEFLVEIKIVIFFWDLSLWDDNVKLKLPELYLQNE